MNRSEQGVSHGESRETVFYLNVSPSERKARRLMQNYTEKPPESVWLCNVIGLQINTECLTSSAYVNHPSEFITNIAAHFIISHPAETRQPVLINLELKRIFSQKCFNFPLNMCISFVPVTVFLWRTNLFQICQLLFRFLTEQVLFWWPYVLAFYKMIKK